MTERTSYSPWIKLILWIALPVPFLAAAWFFIGLPDTTQLRTINPQNWGIRMVREHQARDAGRPIRSEAVWRRLDLISPHLRNAVVMAEDGNFYRHNGFDFEQLKRAMKINWKRKRFAFGGSTLSQQLARTLYLSPRKSLFRKAREALITRRLEKTLTKDRILELYLNTVEWGKDVYGAEAASRHHFNKGALELSPEEAIALAVILPSPRKWDPNGETDFLVRRKEVIYERMVRAGFLPPRPGDPPPPDLDGIWL